MDIYNGVIMSIWLFRASSVGEFEDKFFSINEFI